MTTTGRSGTARRAAAAALARLVDRGARIGAWCSWHEPLPVRILQDGGVVIAPPLVLEDDPAIDPAGAGD